jgi:hypothetical protein
MLDVWRSGARGYLGALPANRSLLRKVRSPVIPLQTACVAVPSEENSLTPSLRHGLVSTHPACRMLGQYIQHIWPEAAADESTFAILGAASMLAGTTRLTLYARPQVARSIIHSLSLRCSHFTTRHGTDRWLSSSPRLPTVRLSLTWFKS